ncbi:MAG: hypothetical protein ACYC0H_21910 [Solirubrobacteraceae bacterium]
MDLNSINPNAHNDQEQFPIGDSKFVTIPLVAKAVSVTACSRRLQRGVEIYDGITIKVPEFEAAAIAAAVVDPTQVRTDMERKRFSFHRTPSGYTLISLETRLWTAALSPDGANGRGRLEVRLSGGSVWPLPDESDASASMRYRTRDIDHLRAAVRDNAKRIISPDLRQSVRQHPSGVWNPVFVTAAQAIEFDPDGGEDSVCGFVHTIEGSTRAVTSLEGLEIGFDQALAYAGSTSDLVRRTRAGVAGRVSIQPGNEDVHYAIKVLTIPAHVIIGVLDDQHQVSERAFPQVISEFVVSIHEQPRPWNVLAQGGVRGERLVVELVSTNLLTADQGTDIIGRDDNYDVTTPTNVVTGRLIRATSHPTGREAVRRAILEDPARHHLTKKRYAQTVGALLLPLYASTQRQKTAAAALTNEFQPSALNEPGWAIRADMTVTAVLDEALAELESQPGAWSPASRELVARGITAVTTLGLLLSDQGSAVQDANWLRGSVANVVSKLALCAGGLKIIAEAIEYIEGRQDLPPLLYAADGQPELVNGAEFRLVPDGGANVRIRQLAFREDRPDEDDEPDDEFSPYDRFLRLQRKVVTACGALEDLVAQLYEDRDDTDQVLIDKHGLQREIMGQLPQRISELRDKILLALEDEPDPMEQDPDDVDAREAVERAMTGEDPSGADVGGDPEAA